MAVIKYENVRLRETTKTGKLKKDDNGYYDVILGAMNTTNKSGEFYPMEGAEKIFTGSSIYHKRITDGKLYGEHGHPKPDGLSTVEFNRRLLQIREERWGTFIKEVTLDDQLWKKHRSIVSDGAIIIVGKVMPYGECASVVEAGLSNPDINFAYSVRSFTRNKIVGGRRWKTMVELVTWDSVGSQGKEIAEKYYSPGLESDEYSISMDSIQEASQVPDDVTSSLESEYSSFDNLLVSAGEPGELEEELKPRKKIWVGWK